MKNIKVEEFVADKNVLVCYIYGVTKKDDGTLKLVHYYKKSDKKGVIEKDWYCGVSEFAKYLINGERIAYAGKIDKVDDIEVMKNPSLVTVITIDGNLCLTTASDDSKSNNLLNLPEIAEPKKDT